MLPPMKKPMELTASQEDYLETILGLIREVGVARVRDIASRLSVAKSSVTVALRSLSKRGLVNYEPYEWVTLTNEGEGMADRIMRRHHVIRSFLMDVLDVDERVADENACRMEHVMGDRVMSKLQCFVDFMAGSRAPACELPKSFSEHCRSMRLKNGCEACPAGPAAATGRKSKPSRNKPARNENMTSNNTSLTLADLKPGQMGVIRRINAKTPGIRRLAEMGVNCGAPVKVLRVAPLGDPVEIEVRGYNLSLRKEEAELVSLEV